jgi:chemotaxis protein histidine kinase CheA
MNRAFLRLLPLFLLDVKGSLNQMDEALRALARDARNREAGHTIGRALHSIKGNAMMMGCELCDAIAEAARVAEVLTKRDELDAETVITLTGARQALGRLIGGLASRAAA